MISSSCVLREGLVRRQSKEPHRAYKPTTNQGCSWEPCVKSEVLEIGQGRSNTVGRGRLGSRLGD